MKRNPIVIILNDIRSTLNVGAIFRTADAILAEKIYLSGITATPDHPKVTKTSLGAENSVPWEYRENVYLLIDELKKSGYQVLGLELSDNSINFWNAKYKYPIALIVGNEVEGISQKLLDKCDIIIDIPMKGAKESLNVATAAGIALFETTKPFLK